MLTMYGMQQPIKWEDYLYFVEFTYNKSYHASLRNIPFEVLFGRKYMTLINWNNLEDKLILRFDMLK